MKRLLLAAMTIALLLAISNAFRPKSERSVRRKRRL